VDKIGGEMLWKILQILPVFIYKWIARKFCQEVEILGTRGNFWVMPSWDLLIRKKRER